MNYKKIILRYGIKNGILALGAQSKAAFCFARGNTAYLSDSAGDLADSENFKKFEKQIRILQAKLKIKPDIIARDMHPEYISTKYTLRTTNDERRTTKIQHHEAHVASCMADNNVRGRVIGVAFDGTGFGRDGNIWGGEFFAGDIRGLRRAAHLRYIPMPGGEACVREPRRMAFSYLYSVYRGKLRLLRRFAPRNDMLSQMIDKKINSPLTSSMGRLFDAVSSLAGVCDFAGYEGEAAIGLEKIIAGEGWRVKGGYKFKYIDKDGVIIIDWEPVIKEIVRDLKDGISKSEISLKFHNAVCEMIKEACNLLRKRYKINKVCLSGGVFQNKYISGRVKPLLEKDGFKVYAHKRVPTHDGGIAIGQAILAATLIYKTSHTRFVK